MRQRTPEALTPVAGQELRLTDLTRIQIRAAAKEGDPIGFAGVAAVMGVRTQVGGKWGWMEEIKTGAFDETLAEDDIRMLKNHNTDLPLARTTAGSLRLAATKSELEVDADMDPVSYAHDLAISLERGTVSGMSIGFIVKADEWTELEADDPDTGKTYFNELRIIHKIELWEVSPVTFPAYVDTEAGLRARELELVARAHGLDDDEKLHEYVRQMRTARGRTAAATPLTPAATPVSPTTPVGRHSNLQLARMG